MNTVFNIAIIASVFHLTHNNNNKKPICVTHSAWHEHEKEGVAFKTFSIELCVLVPLFYTQSINMPRWPMAYTNNLDLTT